MQLFVKKHLYLTCINSNYLQLNINIKLILNSLSVNKIKLKIFEARDFSVHDNN